MRDFEAKMRVGSYEIWLDRMSWISSFFRKFLRLKLTLIHSSENF